MLLLDELAQIGHVLSRYGRPDLEAKVYASLVPGVLISFPIAAKYGLPYVSANLAALSFLRMAAIISLHLAFVVVHRAHRL